MKALTRFPEDFEPLVIVAGDRREVPPRTKGDLLAYSVSTTDVMYLALLNIKPGKPGITDSLILSDKQFATDKEEDLRRRFGQTNILVVGSPAVNLLARRINQKSPFRFDISEETREELAEQERFMADFDDDDDDLFIYHQCLEGILDENLILARFVGIALDLDQLRVKARRIVEKFKKTLIYQKCLGNHRGSGRETHRRPIRHLMHKLDCPGIVDPYYANTVRGKAIPQSKDYGMIAVLPNPFSDSDEYAIVYVAGVHGPGTALGVKMLADRRAFDEHPYGGVYEVKIYQHAAYFERIQRSKSQWETQTYALSDPPPEPPAQSLQTFLSSPSGREDTVQRDFNARFKQYLTEVCRKKGFFLRMEEPYSIALGGEEDFWRRILEYERACDFVIHDITGYARGVMVEIGFSYGSGRKYFLIWNTGKAPLDGWKQKRPKLLGVTHVESIDLGRGEVVGDTLQRKILDLISARDGRPVKEADAAPARSGTKVAFVYTRSLQLLECVRKFARAHEVRCISEDEFNAEARITRIRDALRVSQYALIELADEDLDALIVLGMAKAAGNLKVFPMGLERHQAAEFAWSDKIIHFGFETLERDLESPLERLFSF